jgi:hypothetical protein
MSAEPAGMKPLCAKRMKAASLSEKYLFGNIPKPSANRKFFLTSLGGSLYRIDHHTDPPSNNDYMRV